MGDNTAKRGAQKTCSKKGHSRRVPPPAFGSPVLRWADYDPSYRGNNRLSVYQTKADQRGNRPDLKPIPVLVVPLTDECISEIRHKMAEAFNGSYDGHLHKDALTAMLCAIGIVANKESSNGGRKRRLKSRLYDYKKTQTES